MRRGLISWSKTELPAAALDARAARAQAAMAAAGVDALAIYSDPARSGGASWLTGFVPYWNRGLVVLPRAGRPVLFTGMSNRVHGWIKRNANLETVSYATAIGEDAARFIAGRKADAVVALADSTSVPSDVALGLAAGGLTVIDGSALMEKARTPADPAELAFYFHAAAIARAGLAAASATENDAAALVGAVEGEARRLGAEEIYVALAPDLGRRATLYRLEGTVALSSRFALRVSVAYKGTWVRMLRTLSRAPDPEGDAVADAFATAVAELPKTQALQSCKSWLIEGCRVTQPLEPLLGTMLDGQAGLAPGTVVTVQATIATQQGPVVIGGPVLIGRPGEASALLVPLDFG